MRFDKLDLNLLIALDHMLTLKSVSKTAEKMNLTQSAMSNALGRLRDYFDDQLLVPVGRNMKLTPKAVALQEQVRDIVVRINAMVKSDLVFDPTSSDREFKILLSDYTMTVLMPHVLSIVAESKATVRLRMEPQVDKPYTAIERGDADVSIAPLSLISQTHPYELMFEDEFVCVADRAGAFGENTALTIESYLRARHVRMVPPNTNYSLDEEIMSKNGFNRMIDVRCYAFSALPHLVIGSDLLATMQKLLARRLALALPLTVHPLPFDAERVKVCLQWHTYKSQDPALLWLRQTFRAAAARMQADEAARSGG